MTSIIGIVKTVLQGIPNIFSHGVVVDVRNDGLINKSVFCHRLKNWRVSVKINIITLFSLHTSLSTHSCSFFAGITQNYSLQN